MQTQGAGSVPEYIIRTTRTPPKGFLFTGNKQMITFSADSNSNNICFLILSITIIIAIAIITDERVGQNWLPPTSSQFWSGWRQHDGDFQDQIGHDYDGVVTDHDYDGVVNDHDYEGVVADYNYDGDDTDHDTAAEGDSMTVTFVKIN